MDNAPFPFRVPLIFIMDSLQPWSAKQEYLVRFLVDVSVFVNAVVWIHTSLQLVPMDLLTTIGNVLILWPSSKEAQTLTALLPSEKVELGEKEYQQGAFLHLVFFGGKWKPRRVDIEIVAIEE